MAVTTPVVAEARIGHFAEAQVLRKTRTERTGDSLAPDLGKEGDGASKRPKARTRGAKCLVVTGVDLVRCAWLQSGAREPLVPRPPPTVPTVGAGRAGPGDLLSAGYVAMSAIVGRPTAGGYGCSSSSGYGCSSRWLNSFARLASATQTTLSAAP